MSPQGALPRVEDGYSADEDEQEPLSKVRRLTSCDEAAAHSDTGSFFEVSSTPRGWHRLAVVSPGPECVASLVLSAAVGAKGVSRLLSQVTGKMCDVSCSALCFERSAFPALVHCVRQNVSVLAPLVASYVRVTDSEPVKVLLKRATPYLITS